MHACRLRQAILERSRKRLVQLGVPNRSQHGI
jgi:hypothetical protein